MPWLLHLRMVSVSDSVLARGPLGLVLELLLLLVPLHMQRLVLVPAVTEVLLLRPAFRLPFHIFPLFLVRADLQDSLNKLIPAPFEWVF